MKMVGQPLCNDVGEADDLHEGLLGASQHVVGVHHDLDGRQRDAIRPVKREAHVASGQVLDIGNSADARVGHGVGFGLDSRQFEQHNKILPPQEYCPFLLTGDYDGLYSKSSNHIKVDQHGAIAALTNVDARHPAFRPVLLNHEVAA